MQAIQRKNKYLLSSDSFLEVVLEFKFLLNFASRFVFDILHARNRLDMYPCIVLIFCFLSQANFYLGLSSFLEVVY